MADIAKRGCVTVVVLNWNRWPDTLACLDALDRLRGAYEVLVVDNGSTDGSEARLRGARPDLRFIQSGGNLGYAGGNNIGIRQALTDGAEFVWVLNNDARPRPEALEGLLAALQPQVGILASVLEPPKLATALRGAKHLFCDGCDAGFHEADVVLGASLFFRADVFRDVGLFDERYFHYAEEQDLALRAYRAGWRLGLACGSVVDHEAGNTLPAWSPQASYYKIRNLILFERRFYGRTTAGFLLRNGGRLRAHLALRTSLRQRDGRRIVAVSLAISDAVLGRVGQRDLGDRYHRI